MFKKLFKFILFLCFLFLMLVAVSLFLPSKYHIERTITIDAPAADIYQIVATPKTYNDWTAWNTKEYPKMQYSFEGPETGVGAISKWTDPDKGGGQLTIVKADPKTGIETLVNFDICENPMHGKFHFEETGEGKTKVTWSADGTSGINPIFRYMGYFMEQMMGPDYESGLKGLKKKAEAGQKKEDNKKEDDKPQTT